MQNRMAIECVDRILKVVLNSKELFCGKTVVFAGDFRQILPVGLQDGRCKRLKSSYIWPHITQLRLTENVRVQSGCSAFLNFLSQVGEGTAMKKP